MPESVEFVGAETDLLGESPVWDDRQQILRWADIEGRRMRSFDPSAGTVTTIDTPARPGSFVMTDTDEWLCVAMETDCGFFNTETGVWNPQIELEPAGTRNRLNDGRCDRQGRYWVGSMFEDASARRFTGMRHRLDGPKMFTTDREEVGVSNGLAFSPDGNTMYWADSFRRTVWSYDYDTSSGMASNERVFTDFAALPGSPDGACVDASGCYWVACVDGWALARLSPNGDIDRLIELPIQKPTMPAFGGSDMTTLFVTSITTAGSTPLEPGQPDAGRLAVIETSYEGISEPRLGWGPAETSR